MSEGYINPPLGWSLVAVGLFLLAGVAVWLLCPPRRLVRPKTKNEEVRDLLESMSGAELDAAFRAVLQLIGNDDLVQALLNRSNRTRSTLGTLLLEAERAVAEAGEAAERHERSRRA